MVSDTQKVKFYRRLKTREAREETGCTAAEGVRVVTEALRSPLEVPELFLSEELPPQGGEEIRRALETRQRLGKTVIHRLPESVFRSMAHTMSPQGAAAVVRLPKEPPPPETLDKYDKTVILNRPQDPGNVGTVLRGAEAASFDAVVIIEPACDPYNPKAVRASMGSVFRMPVFRLPSCQDMTERLWRRGGQILAADPHASRSLYDLEIEIPLAVIFGGETAGLPRLSRSHAVRFSLPMREGVDSLNLAMAATVVLYEIRRRELEKGGGKRASR